ncbi:MAG: ParA family protein [candidate division Zixibacteria bacterium]|nr:ParA family protein [candidate division Zixibacteria bacterium]NIR66542.1 ParA family protein [candidate division Zixibacteria bacterium]NIS17865.1 ParA family protein [candidate division Zixibacteria bacterium]NIS48104.1 ParA family protein [candidate division Zixibacteria bacterium]NIT54153.1 ParA family protein [candidate division Zixibacteria bacterium]
MIRIAIMTSKGGTGKTTTAINLGHCLALSGKKVLIIDCDSQGNVAMAFNQQPNRGLAELLLTGEVDIVKARNNLYLIDSGGKRLVESEMVITSQSDREVRMSQVFKNLVGSDYVICDCPPTINLINVNALNYCDYVIIPVSMDYFAAEGVKKTLALIQEIEEKIGHSVTVMGILATFFDKRTRISDRVYDKLIHEFGDRVFVTKIRVNTQIKEAQENHKTIFEYAPYSHGALDYFLLTKEVANGHG